MSGMESAIVNALIKQQNYTSLDQAKIRYGVHIILSELYKAIIVYGVALLFHCLVPTLIAHLTFLVLRQKSFGYHFAGKLSCIAWSIIAFPFLAAFLGIFQLPYGLMLGISMVSAIIIFAYAPAGTLKHPIVNDKHRSYLKKHTRIRLLAIILLIIVLPSSIQLFVVQGLCLQSLAILIQTIKGEDSNECKI